MAQYARPDGDGYKAAWSASSGSDLYAMLDETSASDTDYIISDAGTTDYVEIYLSNITDPGVDTGFTLRVRLKATGSGAGEKVSVVLYEGTSSRYALLSADGISRSWTTYEDTADVSNITDFTNLRIRIWATTIGAGETISCSWIELEAPDAAGPTLVVADSGHGHSADGSLALTQVHSLTVQDSGHSHTPETPPLTQVHSLVAQESSHGHSAENATITVVTDLVVQEASHAHGAENVDLTQDHILVVAESSHSHGAEGNLALTQVHVLDAQESNHGHYADGPDLSTAIDLEPADALHSHGADNVTVTQLHVLVVQEASHSHVVDGNLGLAQAHNITVQESAHNHLVDGLFALTQLHVLVAQDSWHNHYSDGVPITGGEMIQQKSFVHYRNIPGKVY